MSVYRCFYQSMTATYGPAFVTADSADEAKRKFAMPARLEQSLVSVREVSEREVRAALSASGRT